MSNRELNERGEKYVAETMKPYRELEQILSEFRTRMSDYGAKYHMEIVNEETIRDAYDCLAEAVCSAEDDLLDLEDLAEKTAEAIMQDPEYSRKSVDD